MEDSSKTKQELIEENSLLKKKIKKLEKSESTRKLVEKTLQQQTDAMDAAIDGIAILNEKGEYIYLNKAHVNVYGYDNAGELIGKSWTILYDSDELQRFEQKIMPEFRQNGHWHGEAIGKKADGGNFPQELSLTALDSGGLICVVRDITERKHTQDALRESEKRYRELTNFLPISIFEVDATGNIISFNRTARKFFRYNEEDYKVGMNALQFFIPEEWQRVGEKMGKVMQGTSNPGQEFTFIRKDGSTFIGLIYSAPNIQQNKAVGIKGAIIDITDRKQMENKLRESEKQLMNIIDFLPDATLAIDKEGRVIIWNKAIERMTGVPAAEMIGKSNYEYAIPFYGERRPIVIDLALLPDEEFEKREYSAVIRSADTLYGEVYVPKTYGGKGAYLSATASRLRDTAGNITGAIESTRDITDRKRAEEEKRLLQERLNRAEKMESLGTLAGGVAHDLNNVLGVIVGFAELALGGVDKDSPLRRHLENVMNGGLKAAAIVDDLLTLARRGVPDREVLNLNNIIADCQESPELEKLFSYHPSVQFKTDIDPDLLNISGSSVHLGKSLYNLISNAAEAMPKGGILAIKTANQYLDKPISGYDNIRGGDYVVLSVSDTGEGIPADNLKRIFEPFYTKKVMGRSGTGLGLAVVWGTVKDHNGYINVQSEERKGSTFTLYFPVTRENIPEKTTTVAISEYMGKGESILVVDDVKEQRDLAIGMLKSLNYNVSSVSSGEDAITYLKERQADMIILDMIMDPGMDGLDAYKSILKIYPSQKAIIVSGFSESERVKTARGLGAGAYVRKPYVKEKLGLAVKKELARK